MIRGRGGHGGGGGRYGARGGGRGARGGGRGRGRGPGQRDNGYRNNQTHNVIHEGDEEDMDVFEHDDNDTSNEVNHYSNVLYNIRRAQRLNINNNSTLIIDSASTVDIIGDINMVHDIHHAPQPLRVRTVNGSATISKKAYLG